MAAVLDWQRDGPTWPHHEASRFVEAGGLRWHVQQMGEGPVALLLHGTGSSTHSWRGLMPLLARHFSVLAMDLPGHAFTSTPPAQWLSLPGMAGLLRTLIDTLKLDVKLVVGHSAGAAIGARMVLDRMIAPSTQIAINGAFFPLAGLPGLLFPPVARLMASTPWAAQLFARRDWDAASVERLIQGTGSRLDAEGIALYGRLVRDPKHTAAALAMMARWDLHPLVRDLARMATPLACIVGENDRAVPARDAWRVRELLLQTARGPIERIAAAGHLVHEEHPGLVASAIFNATKGSSSAA